MAQARSLRPLKVVWGNDKEALNHDQTWFICAKRSCGSHVLAMKLWDIAGRPSYEASGQLSVGQKDPVVTKGRCLMGRKLLALGSRISVWLQQGTYNSQGSRLSLARICLNQTSEPTQ